MSRSISAPWGAPPQMTGISVPLFGILLGYDIPCDHSRRRSRGQRGGARSGEPRHSGASHRDAPDVPHPRPPYRRLGGARLLQLAQEHEARQRGGAVEARTGPAGLAAAGGGPAHGGGGGRSPGRGPCAVLADDHRAGAGSPSDRAVPSGGDRRDGPGGGRRCHRAGLRPAHLRRPVGIAARSHGQRRAGLLRCGGAGDHGGLHRSGARLPPEPLRGRRPGRRLSERALRARRVRAVRRRAAGGRAGYRERLREPGLVPGLPAHRGDRPRGTRRAALRHAEARGADRSPYGTASLGRPRTPAGRATTSSASRPT